MTLKPGTVLGQYEIRAPLGAGGMGEVYRAHDTRLDREVAIKVLPQSFTSDPDRLRRFEQEARAAAALNHPNILAVYQMATQDGVSYLVSELLEGETLRERLMRGSVPLRKAIEYAGQIAHGLAAPHEKGIVHRDLKPENLFITNDGRVKILDFGLAKVSPSQVSSGADATLTQATEPGVVMGTVGYMSPEQVHGKNADHRSDIFAFGAILYELVTGKQTFRKPTSAETMAAILNEDPPPVSQLVPNAPPALQRIVNRCLEKNPEQRFQSASDLAFALEALSDPSVTSGSHAAGSAPVSHRRTAIVGLGIAIAAAAALFTYFGTRPLAIPKVSNYVQLTHDGRPKGVVGTEASRLYVYVTTQDYQGMAEMSISGGEPRKLPILSSSNFSPVSLSPDGSELLIVDGHGVPPKGPLSSVPVLSGSPRRLGDIECQDAVWSADGRKLAYSNAGDLFVAKADGTESRKVVALKDPALIFSPVFSPDGTHLRFTAQDRLDRPAVLWEVSLDGKDSHRLLPGFTNPPDSECCGIWMPDGKFFLFWSRSQIWAIPGKPAFLHSELKPIQLTSSPLSLSAPLPSKDGKKLFTVGQTFRGELDRFDAKSGQFVPALGGISAEYVDYSKDGQWVTYVAFPEGTLWRSRVDGSERLQLTYPPGYAMMPRWSPNGKEIAFHELLSDKPTKIYIVSSEGGTLRPLLSGNEQSQQDPNWSADGSKIIFAGSSADASSEIQIVDVATHQVTAVPGSHGFFSPRWSSNGRYIPAFSADLTRIELFDSQTQKWSEVAKGSFSWLNFTKDGQSLILLDTSGTGAIIRIRVSDLKRDQLVDLKNFVATGRYGNSLSLMPDDSFLMLRNAGTHDIYSLDWENP